MVYFHVSSNQFMLGFCSHTWGTWMASHSCGFFHVSDNLSLFGYFHVSTKKHFSSFIAKAGRWMASFNFFEGRSATQLTLTPWKGNCVLIPWDCTCAHVGNKNEECGEQHGYQICDKSSLYMYFKKLSFSGFSHPVEPEIRIFFHQNMPPCIRLNLRP